jgi:hypothetical protein
MRSSAANVEQRFGRHARIQGGRLDPRAQRHHSSQYLRHGGGVPAAKQNAALPAVCVPNFTLEPPSLRLSAATLSPDRGLSKTTAAWACGISCIKACLLISRACRSLCKSTPHHNRYFAYLALHRSAPPVSRIPPPTCRNSMRLAIRRVLRPLLSVTLQTSHQDISRRGDRGVAARMRMAYFN